MNKSLIVVLSSVSVAVLALVIILLMLPQLSRGDPNDVSGIVNSSDVISGGMQVDQGEQSSSSSPVSQLTLEGRRAILESEYPDAITDSNGSLVAKKMYTIQELTEEEIQSVEGFSRLVDKVRQSNSPDTASIDGSMYVMIPGRGNIEYSDVQTLDGAIDIKYSVEISSAGESGATTQSDAGSNQVSAMFNTSSRSESQMVVLKIDFLGEKMPIYFTDLKQSRVSKGTDSFLLSVYKQGVGVFPLKDYPEELVMPYISNLMRDESFMSQPTGMYSVDIVKGRVDTYSTITRYVAKGKLKNTSSGSVECKIGDNQFGVILEDLEFQENVIYDLLFTSTLNGIRVRIM